MNPTNRTKGYPDLSALLAGSASTRRYFLSLPVRLQILLHQNHSHIRTAEELHRTAEILQGDNPRLHLLLFYPLPK